MSPVSKGTLSVPPVRFTASSKVTVTFISSPIPYLPSLVEDVIFLIVGRVVSTLMALAALILVGIVKSVNVFPATSLIAPDETAAPLAAKFPPAVV